MTVGELEKALEGFRTVHLVKRGRTWKLTLNGTTFGGYHLDEVCATALREETPKLCPKSPENQR